MGPFAEARDRIKQALAKHPHVVFKEDEHSITVEAQDDAGYSVTLQDDGDQVTLWADPYHEHFDEAESAFSCFMWMLTPAYRVVEFRRGKHTIGADLERVIDGKVERLGRFRILLPLFGKKETRAFQNHWLPVPPTELL